MTDSKKYLLSGAVIVAFLGYTLHYRLDEPETVSVTPQPTSATPAPLVSNTKYQDGQYIGNVTDAYYGNVQVQTTISGGKITAVKFLDYPQDHPHSREINTQAMPYLISEAIRSQSAQVDIVTGATETSRAYIESLSSALVQAKL